MLEKMKALLRDKQKLRELALYVLFGAMTTAVNWVVYVLCTLLLGLEGQTQGSAAYLLIGNIANVTAWVLSVLFAYFTNKKFVFQSRATAQSGAWREFSLFVSARVLSYLIFDLLLYSVLLYVMDDRLDKLLMNVLVVIFNYVASRFVVFRKTKKEKR